MFNLFNEFNSNLKCTPHSFSVETTDIVIDPNYVHTDHNLSDPLYQLLINRKLHSFCYWLFGQQDDYFYYYFEEHDYNFGLIQGELQTLREQIEQLPDNNYIVYNTNNKLTLDTNYLTNQGIIVPANAFRVIEFDLQPANYYIQPGVEQIYTSLVHQEANADAIDSDLCVVVNDKIIQDNIPPSNSFTEVYFKEPLTLYTTQTETFEITLQCSDGSFISSKTIYINSIFPSYIGGYAEDSITVADMDENLSKITLGEDLAGTTRTVTIEGEAKYIYFCVPQGKYIGSVTMTTFIVPIEYRKVIEGTLNNVSCKYNYYRTSSRLIPGTYQFVIN
jgi:hypothetical protein